LKSAFNRRSFSLSTLRECLYRQTNHTGLLLRCTRLDYVQQRPIKFDVDATRNSRHKPFPLCSLCESLFVINSQALADLAPHVGSGQASYFGSGARPEGPRVGIDFLGMGQPASALSSPSWVRGRAPAADRFSCILQVLGGLSWNLLGPSSGDHCPLGPLNSFMQP